MVESIKCLHQVDDMATLNPEFYEKRILYLSNSKYKLDGITIEDLGLYFIDDSHQQRYMYENHPQSLELKPGGEDTMVTEENKQEYIELLCMRRMVHAVEPQIQACRDGLSVFISEETQKYMKVRLFTIKRIDLIHGSHYLCFRRIISLQRISFG